MGLKTWKIVLLVIKIILMVIIAAIIAIASYAIFGSRAFKLRAKDSTTGKRPEYDKFVTAEYMSLVFAVVSFLLLLVSSVLHCVSPEGRRKCFTNGDITLCFSSATCILITGILLLFASAGECEEPGGGRTISDLYREYKGDQATFLVNEDYFIGGGNQENKSLSKLEQSIGNGGSGNFKSHTCETFMTVPKCEYKICKDVWLVDAKMSIWLCAVAVGCLGFWVPCLLAYSVYKKRDLQNGVNRIGGGNQPMEQPGGDEGTLEYPLYVPSQPQFQNQYGGGGGGAYVYQNQPAPQMSPSQNPAMTHPQQNEYPLYNPQY